MNLESNLLYMERDGADYDKNKLLSVSMERHRLDHRSKEKISKNK